MDLEEFAQQTNQMVAIAVRVLQKQLQGGDPSVLADEVREPSANCLSGTTALLPSDILEATVPSVVYKNRLFKLYVPSAAQEISLVPENYKQVKRIPNSDMHVM